MTIRHKYARCSAIISSRSNERGAYSTRGIYKNFTPPRFSEEAADREERGVIGGALLHASRNHTRSLMPQKKHSICRPYHTRRVVYPSSACLFYHADKPRPASPPLVLERASLALSRTCSSDREEEKKRIAIRSFRPRRARVSASRIRIESKLGRNEIFRRRANTDARSLLTYVRAGSRISSRRVASHSRSASESGWFTGARQIGDSFIWTRGSSKLQ